MVGMGEAGQGGGLGQEMKPQVRGRKLFSVILPPTSIMW